MYHNEVKVACLCLGWCEDCAIPVNLTSSSCSKPPCLLRHAADVGRSVGAVEHWSWHLRLLSHQCHGGEDPHAGKRPLYPPVCDRRPVGGPHPAHDLHTLEKTLKPH